MRFFDLFYLASRHFTRFAFSVAGCRVAAMSLLGRSGK